MSEDNEFYFDRAAADLACAFFEKLLVHVKGEWAGRNFALQPWQRDDIIRPLFGWKRRSDGTRRYRTAYIEIPRKNGKSTLSAGIGLFLLFADDEPGAEVYSAAADRDQASIVFEVAKSMVEGSPHLLRRAKVYRRQINTTQGGFYRVLSADAYTKHGLNASAVVFDELHAQPNRELWDVLNTSTGARRQPLMVMITTAGYDRESICYEQHEYAKEVLAGRLIDPSFFAYIAAAEEDDDWTSPVIWAKANPGLGETVKLDYLAGEALRAQQVPAYQNTFRRLHLNQWTSQDSRFLDMAAWDACSGQLPDLSGRRCYGGLDLASTTDMAAFVLVFPPAGKKHEGELPDISGLLSRFNPLDDEDEPFWIMPFFWVPGDNLIGRERRDRTHYHAWATQGLITATPGNVIDYATIERDIVALGERYNIAEIAFDRWGAESMRQALEGHGLTMIAMGQGFASLSGPTKELVRLILSGDIAHGGNPVLRWMADGVAVRQDPAGNVKPDKSKSTRRIDGIVAGIMALDRAVRNEGDQGSVYDERGIREL